MQPRRLRRSAAIAAGFGIAIGVSVLVADTRHGLGVLAGSAFCAILLGALTAVDEPLPVRPARLGAIVLSLVLGGAAIWHHA